MNMIMENMETVVKDFISKDANNRKDLVNKYGSWYKSNASEAELVSWCNSRIKTYNEWIRNCEELKSKKQQELLSGISEEDLRKALELIKRNKDYDNN